MIAQTLGGIGLFLVGMLLVTDGLRAAAGDALRTFLLRYTGGPLKALFSGAAVTALIQSSSATTVATIGFVGAGLLTFEQSLGLIFGANIGTTATGWIVALLGLKFSVSQVALPIVGVGALVKLFSRGRLAHVGLALSGFGILFVGIDVLQAGMEGVSEWITPEELPGDTIGGRLLLVLIGMVLTTVMQSSSAAMATALAALHGNTMSLEQAAAMVIGINIGTTVTAGLAAIGASTAAKRTAFAHLLFNAVTGVVAIAGLPLFVWGAEQLGSRIAPGDATILLAGFHTVFNVVGVALVLPFSKRFAAMVVRVIRHRGPHLTRRLDPVAAHHGSVAAEAVRHTAIDISREVVELLGTALESGRLTSTESDRLDAASRALRETEEYVETLRFAVAPTQEGHQRHLSTIHALDHVRRLLDVATAAAREEAAPVPEIQEIAEPVRRALQEFAEWTAHPDRAPHTDQLEALRHDMAASRRALRREFLARTADGQIAPTVAATRLDRLRGLEDTAYHLWRLAENLSGERNQGPAD